MSQLEQLKEIMLRPRKELQPLLRFRGATDIVKVSAWWNFLNAMRLNECETIAAGTRLARETDLPHFCGRHAKYTEHFGIRCFVNRLKQSPRVMKIIPGMFEYVEQLWPEGPWPLQIVDPHKRAHNTKVLKKLKQQFGRSTDIRYLFSTTENEQRLLRAVHDAVPRNLSFTIRNDVCQDLLCAVIAGDIKEGDLCDEVQKYIREANRLRPHSREDFPKAFVMEKGGDVGAEAWKKLYQPAAPTMEDKVEALHEHWQCGIEPPPIPNDLVSPMSVSPPVENFHMMQRRIRQIRLTKILGNQRVSHG